MTSRTVPRTKYGRQDVRDYLVKIVTEYDAIIIQEIKDKSETMIKDFLADCQHFRNFSMVLSKRFAALFIRGYCSGNILIKYSVLKKAGNFDLEST